MASIWTQRGNSVTLSGGITAATLTVTGLTSGRVVFAGAGGLLSDDADLTFSVNTLTVHTLTVSTGSLTVTGGTVTTGAATDMTLATSGGTQLLVDHVATAVNYIKTIAGTAGIRPTITLDGSEADRGIYLSSKGGGDVVLATNSNVAQFVVNHTASAVNYLQVTGAAASSEPVLSAAGSDTDISINLTPKGAGTVNLTGGQLQFPATQNASSNANTLDDYEEGTWTPTDGSGAMLTFTNPTGQYIKIGKKVFMGYALTYPVTASGAGSVVASFPFALPAGNETRIGYVSYSTYGATIYGTPASNVVNFFSAAGVQLTNVQLSVITLLGTSDGIV